jgi:MoxR-like ATPase
MTEGITKSGSGFGSGSHEAPRSNRSKVQDTGTVDPLGPFRKVLSVVTREVAQVYIGPASVVEHLLVALLTPGHILLEGVPGIAKTTLVRAFSSVLDVEFRRIQFTPDLLPSDVTGVYIPNLQTHEFELRKGPIFGNIVLGDEINRAPAKTQSALLEAMQEGQVTIDGITHRLPDQFLVLATQNPVEEQGVYRLPEAQLDRFLLKVAMPYPSRKDEIRILDTHHRPASWPKPALSSGDIQAMRAIAESVHLSAELRAYIVDMVRFSREHRRVLLGASPRAALALARAAKTLAALKARDFVLPDDVRSLARVVLSHRIILDVDARMSGMETVDIVEEALREVAYST